MECVGSPPTHFRRTLVVGHLGPSILDASRAHPHPADADISASLSHLNRAARWSDAHALAFVGAQQPSMAGYRDQHASPPSPACQCTRATQIPNRTHAVWSTRHSRESDHVERSPCIESLMFVLSAVGWTIRRRRRRSDQAGRARTRRKGNGSLFLSRGGHGGLAVQGLHQHTPSSSRNSHVAAHFASPAVWRKRFETRSAPSQVRGEGHSR